MLSKAPDSAARALIFSAVFWLLVGATALAVAGAKLVLPGLLATRLLSYPRLQAIASISMLYGWLTLAGLAAIFYVVPRVTGARIRSEPMGQLAAMLVNLALLLAVPVTLFGGVQGPAFSELPPYLYAVLVLALALAATNVLRTLARRVEPRLYASVWYFIGALLWAPLALVVGNLHPFVGVPASIAHLFSLNATLTLWFAAVGIGSLYYFVPRASGSPLYSHRLALVGFWSLAFTAPLAAQSRQVFGPAQDWLETVAIASSIALLIPVATVVVNFLGTLRGAWDKVPDHPSIRFFAGGTLFWTIAMLQGTVQSFRVVARNVGATDWITGQVWVLLLGAFTLWSAGAITFALPRLIGRRWFDRTQLTAGFWLSAMGVAAVGVAAFGAGVVTAAVLVAGTAGENPLAAGNPFDVVINAVRPFRVLSLLGLLSFAVGQWMFAVNLFRSTTRGEPRPVEVVAPAEVTA